jgi:hypothetical protein
LVFVFASQEIGKEWKPQPLPSRAAFKGLYPDCDAFFIASTASSADIKGVVFTAFTAP